MCSFRVGKGREFVVPLFRHLTALVKQLFQDVSHVGQRQFEDVLKRIGVRAEDLGQTCFWPEVGFK